MKRELPLLTVTCYVLMNMLFAFCKVNKVLAALQVEVENFILRMAAEFPLRKEQLIFLINNYDMMLAVLIVGISLGIDSSFIHSRDSLFSI